MLKAYSKALQTMPLVTKGTTTAAMFGIGDTLAQLVMEKGGGTAGVDEVAYDARRGAAFVAFGGVLSAPTQHFWFEWMERNVALTWRPLRQATARVCLHSLVYAPFSIASLFVWMELFSRPGEGDLWIAFMQVQPAAIFPIWLAGGSFWIPTMLAVYRFVPLHGRVVVTSIANVVWSTYLSLAKAVAGRSTD